LRLAAFAKINLQLAVTGTRPDGYHELRTVFQSISLHDDLTIERSRRAGIDLTISGAALDAGPENLVCRALDLLSRELKLKSGWRATLRKRIPMGAGLGGGSSDAAAALVGGIRISGKRVAPERLLEMGASLGADVPFFLFGGRVLGVGRGDEVYALEDERRKWVLVLLPQEIRVATPDAYRWLDAKLTKTLTPPRIFVSCARSWSLKDADLLNDFEAVVFDRYPILREMKRRLLQAGAAGAALAGSGSAVFGLFQNPAQARRAAQKFQDAQVFMARTVTRGEFQRLGENRRGA
jgi:4-diphosphocytidyl-2-C-methyl-D-erythritol kinase